MKSNGGGYKFKVSICMIVKNEQANLQRCLDSFLPIINMKDDDTLRPLAELIVVDTGSTDKTVKIAMKYTNKVYQKTFIPWDFSKARNYGIAKARGEKILVVDADEELVQSSVYSLMDAILNPAFKEPTMFFTLRNFYRDDRSEFTEFSQPRLFMNDRKPIYSKSVHNKPRCLEPYRFDQRVVFNHHGYNFENNEDLRQKKNERTLPMLLDEHEKNPDDIHFLMHLVKAYMTAQDWENVTVYGEKFMKLFSTVDYHEGWFSYIEAFENIVSAYVSLKDIEGAERTKDEAEKYTHKLSSIYFVLGSYYGTNDEDDLATHYFEKGVRISSVKKENYELIFNNNINMQIPIVLHWLATRYFARGDYALAGETLNNAIALDKGRRNRRWDIFNEEKASKRLIMND